MEAVSVKKLSGTINNVVIHSCPNVSGSLNLQKGTQDILIKLTFHCKILKFHKII